MNSGLEPTWRFHVKNSFRKTIMRLKFCFRRHGMCLHSLGTGYQVLYTFSMSGAQVPLIQCRNGKLYGTTGGSENGHGIIYSINTDGTGFTTNWDFGSASDGYSLNPASLIQGADGNLYGTMQSGGNIPGDRGIIFSVTLINQVLPPRVSGGGFDAQSGMFSFTISGETNQSFVVESSANLIDWQPIWTNILSGASVEFIDQTWANYQNHFYRVKSN